MTHRERSFAVLLAFFDLARAGLPADPGRLAGRLGLGIADVNATLRRLTQGGFVTRGRLSLTGLAVAASLDRARASMTTALAA